MLSVVAVSAPLDPSVEGGAETGPIRCATDNVPNSVLARRGESAKSCGDGVRVTVGRCERWEPL